MSQAVLEAGLDLSRRVREAGGRALAVGGWVRDRMLGSDSEDLDLEVYGLSLGALERLLRARYAVQGVGKAFGVLKVEVPGLSCPVDVALPRRESKTGLGHKGFEVQVDPHMTPREAASRRDLSVSAMGLDLLSGELVDPFGGAEDLRRGRLRAVDPLRFPEDPLRVLRAASLAARFRLKPDAELLDLCSKPDLAELPRERLFEELQTALLAGRKPSLAFELLRRAGQLGHFPELAALVGVPQEPRWHPEGDVYNHTLLALNAAAAERTGQAHEDLVVLLAVLCHDLGKPSATELLDGRVRSLGHDRAGEAPTRSLLARLTGEVRLIEQVVPLVLEHLRPAQLFEARAGDAAIRRLAGRVPIHRLVRVARADHLGRATHEAIERRFPAGDWLHDRARALAVDRGAPKPVLLGRHLIACGLQPGPAFRGLLDRAYEAQLDGRVGTAEEALAYLGLSGPSRAEG
jgi:tRNA nucleotidyltransferase (CCA-adding enzyme)